MDLVEFINRCKYEIADASVPAGGLGPYIATVPTGFMKAADGQKIKLWMEARNTPSTLWQYVDALVVGTASPYTITVLQVHSSSTGSSIPFTGIVDCRCDIDAAALNKIHNSILGFGKDYIIAWYQSNCVNYDGNSNAYVAEENEHPKLFQKIMNTPNSSESHKLGDIVPVKQRLSHWQDTKNSPSLTDGASGGIPVGFALEYIKAGYNQGRDVVIIPIAIGGTGFRQTSGLDGLWMAPKNSAPNGGSGFVKTRDEGNLALADGVSRIVAVIAHGGEYEAASQTPMDTCVNNWRQFVHTLRGEAGPLGDYSNMGWTPTPAQPDFTTVPFLFGTLKDDWVAADYYGGGSSTIVNNALISLTNDQNISYIGTADCSGYTKASSGGVMVQTGGLVHFASSDLLEMGKKSYFPAYEIAKYKNVGVQPPATPGLITISATAPNKDKTVYLVASTDTQGYPASWYEFQYRIRLSASPWTDCYGGATADQSTENLSVVFNGTNGMPNADGTEYEFQARAANTTGNGPWTAVPAYAVPQVSIAPGSISNVAVGVTVPGQVLLTFAAPTIGDGPFFYVIRWSLDGLTGWTAITGFEVADGNSSTSNAMTCNGSWNGITFTADGVNDIYFDIVAWNGAGQNSGTPIVSPAAIPLAPLSALAAIDLRHGNGMYTDAAGTTPATGIDAVVRWDNFNTNNAANYALATVPSIPNRNVDGTLQFAIGSTYDKMIVQQGDGTTGIQFFDADFTAGMLLDVASIASYRHTWTIGNTTANQNHDFYMYFKLNATVLEVGPPSSVANVAIPSADRTGLMYVFVVAYAATSRVDIYQARLKKTDQSVRLINDSAEPANQSTNVGPITLPTNNANLVLGQWEANPYTIGSRVLNGIYDNRAMTISEINNIITAWHANLPI